MSGRTGVAAAIVDSTHKSDRSVSFSEDDESRLCPKEHHTVAFLAGFQIVFVFCYLTINRILCKYTKGSKKENDPDTQRRWSELDHVILQHVLRRLCHRDSLSFGSVCRRWWTVQVESVSLPTLFPWILLPNQDLDSEIRTLYSPSDGVCFEICVPPKALGKDHCASYHGWLLTADRVNEDHLFLFNPYSGGQVELPKIRYNSGLVYAYMSSDPCDPDCIVAFPMQPDYPVMPYSRLMLCRVGVGDTKWTEYTGNLGSIGSMASCMGRLYCLDVRRNLMTLTSNTLVLIPMDDGELPSMDDDMWTRGTEYLVESCGELFMVLVASKRSSSSRRASGPRIGFQEFRASPRTSGPRIGVQVFRADLSKMTWVKVESLGDRVLFMGPGCSTSLSASDLGVQGSHVYLSYGFPSLHATCYYWLDFNLGSGEGRHWRPIRTRDESIYARDFFWVAPDFLRGRTYNSVTVDPQSIRGASQNGYS